MQQGITTFCSKTSVHGSMVQRREVCTHECKPLLRHTSWSALVTEGTTVGGSSQSPARPEHNGIDGAPSAMTTCGTSQNWSYCYSSGMWHLTQTRAVPHGSRPQSRAEDEQGRVVCQNLTGCTRSGSAASPRQGSSLFLDHEFSRVCCQSQAPWWLVATPCLSDC